jgi:hypothetical protein
MNGWIQSGLSNAAFSNIKSGDFIIRTATSNGNIVFGCGSDPTKPATIYITDTGVGIKRVPLSNATLDISGVLNASSFSEGGVLLGSKYAQTIDNETFSNFTYNSLNSNLLGSNASFCNLFIQGRVTVGPSIGNIPVNPVFNIPGYSYDSNVTISAYTGCNIFLMGSKVGVGTLNPQYALDVPNGSVHAVSFPTTSDARFKTNLTSITNALSNICLLNGYTYDWNESYPGYSNHLDTSGAPIRQIGLIAQEVESVCPEIVSQWSSVTRNGKIMSDTLSVDYGRMAALFVEAFKDISTQLEAQRAENAMLWTALNALSS